MPQEIHQFSGPHSECIRSSLPPSTSCDLHGDRCQLAVASHVEYCGPSVPLRQESSIACYSSTSVDSQLPGESSAPSAEFQGLEYPEGITYSTFHEAPGSSYEPISGMHISTQPSSSTVDQGSITALHHSDNSLPTKIGARFSRQTVRILRDWLGSHGEAPYPSEEEKHRLQDETGLSQTQVENWLANARRRRKIRAGRPFPQNKHSRALPTNASTNPGASIPNNQSRYMNPLERWMDSPPENEAASIIAINKALSSEPGLGPGGSHHPLSSEDSVGSVHQHSLASSGSTSTNESSTSAYSYSSFSFVPFLQGRRRRRKKSYHQRYDKISPNIPFKTFQCTFCTETFERRYDWQRHEKSYHLSLERWVCMPEGCRTLRPQSIGSYCVFCGEIDPDDEHVNRHNYSICEKKPLSDRTFYRKDHLVQHLRLVHGVGYLDWCMRSWRSECINVYSRCGFCGIMLANWHLRQDHLAEHFKMGQTMAHWNGDWGFESAVLDKVQNSMPPYLIDGERNSPFPFSACTPPAESPCNAYELVKLELFYFMTNYEETVGESPTDKKLRLEACRVIFASEVLSENGIASRSSWFRDLLMASEDIAWQAQYGSLRSTLENRLAVLKINGKDHLFDQCPMELELQDYVRAASFLITNKDLQKEATRIIRCTETNSTTPWDTFADWLVRLANSGADWLFQFRQRVHSSRGREFSEFALEQPDPNVVQNTLDNTGEIPFLTGSINSRFPNIEASKKNPLSNLIHVQGSSAQSIPSFVLTGNDEACNDATTGVVELTVPSDQRDSAFSSVQAIATESAVGIEKRKNQAIPFPNDTNAYHRLARALSRYVKTTISLHNPFRHIPTDEELQHQARLILYDDDDPWNQTAADNPEWLLRFRSDIGIACSDSTLWDLEGQGLFLPYK